MTKYNELDSKILNKIGEYPAPFSSLYVKDVAEECIRIAKEENKPEPFRILDRRLQALRKAGVIRSTTKEGANKRGNSSRLTQSFHFFMFEPIFSPVNALNQPI
ncbi:hypothetical protein [Klebsiella quasipneumoniae]|uniref:hypothetical protein n=1 Tax=Klebsiella quasipneumoniae TaxID=1463165 RepID=UPI0039796576